MGTELGVKGVGLDERAPERVRRLRALVDASTRRPELVVDGGIRRETVPPLAAAGADGVVPGSLVFGARDPAAAVRWVQQAAAVRLP
jgi:ribulose-phosphate 3-epimerase